MSTHLHTDELSIDAALVRRLVDAQLPQYAALPINRLGASGSSNVLFRLGEDFLVRLPRQPGGGSAILKEHKWLPILEPALPVATPRILHLGDPDFSYPEQWSIVAWLNGRRVTSWQLNQAKQTGTTELAEGFAELILALRRVAVPDKALDAPHLHSYRGASLQAYDTQTRINIEQCRLLSDLDLDLDAALALWEKALTLPGATESRQQNWHHGDLVAENLLTTDGRLSGVLDFGSMGIGDPTIDLHGAWEVLSPAVRETLRQRLGVDDAEWLRGRAWALADAS